MGFDMAHFPFQHIGALGYALPRILGVFSVLPLIGRETMPLFLRLALASCLALFVMPALLDEVAAPRAVLVHIMVVLKEALLGFALGFLLSVPLWAVEAMGDMVDTQRGASIAQTLNPLTGHDTSPLGQFFNLAVVTFLLVIGGFVAMLGVLFQSYAFWPVFDWWPPVGPEAAHAALAMLDDFMRLALLLAAPVLFVMFLAEAGLALLSRYVPQLQVFFLAMSVKSALAILMFALYAFVLFDHIHVVIEEAIGSALGDLHRMYQGVRAP